MVCHAKTCRGLRTMRLFAALYSYCRVETCKVGDNHCFAANIVPLPLNINKGKFFGNATIVPSSACACACAECSVYIPRAIDSEYIILDGYQFILPPPMFQGTPTSSTMSALLRPSPCFEDLDVLVHILAILTNPIKIYCVTSIACAGAHLRQFVI